MRRTSQYSSWACCAHKRRITRIPPYITASIPLHSCYVPPASFASFPLTLSTHFAIIRLQVSPTTIGHTPGHLSRPSKRLVMSARYAVHEGCSFTSHSMKSATICRSSSLASTKRSNQCYMLMESVPPDRRPLRGVAQPL